MKRPLMICLIISLIFLIAVTQSVWAVEYSFERIDYPGADWTEVRGSNDAGKIVGRYGYKNADGETTVHGFLYDDNTNTYTTIDKDGSVEENAASDINDAGMISGKFGVRGSGFDGFRYDSVTGTFDTFVYTFDTTPPTYALSTCPNGINNAGIISGAYKTQSDVYPDYDTWHGFLYDGISDYKDFKYTYPDGSTVAFTDAIHINNSNQIVGFYMNHPKSAQATEIYGFLYDSLTETFYKLDYSNASWTRAFGINDNNQIVGQYEDAYGKHGFLYDVGTDKYITIDHPNANWTWAFGINNNNQIVGWYEDADDNKVYGFVAEPSLVASWPMDENGGGIVYDETTNNNGDIYGATWTTESKLGLSALYFDGVDDNVGIANSDDINTGSSYTDRTITAWFKVSDVNTRQMIYEEGGGARGFNIYVSNGRVYVGGWNRAEYYWDGTWLSTSISADTWYNVALVLKNGATFNGYINGVLFDSGSGGTVYTHSGDINIGRNGGTYYHDSDVYVSNGEYFKGTIDEVKIYNSALTAEEIGNILVAFWPMDENGGGIVDDQTPNNNYGTVYGAAWTTESQVGLSALYFDGVDDYVGVADSDDINTGSSYTDRTITAWFKVSDVNTRQMIYEEGGGGRGFNIYLNSGRVYVGGWNLPEDESGWLGTWLSTSISADTWYHVALVLENGTDEVRTDNNKFKGYLNGVEFGSGSGGKVYTHGGDINIGMAGNTLYDDSDVYVSEGEYFNGTIDEVKIYNSALTAEEIAKMAHVLVAFWPMDENGGGIVNDQTPNNNYGTVYGAAWTTDSQVGLSALKFDGNGYVLVANSDDINTGSSYTDRTITAWFKVDNVNSRQMLYEEGGGTRGFNIYVDTGGRLYVGGWNLAEDAPWETWLSTSGSISVNTWYHVALVLKNGATFRGYFNGVEFGSGSGGKVYAHGGDINIGRAGNTLYHDSDVYVSEGEYFKGTIDEGKIYNSALTAEEIAERSK